MARFLALIAMFIALPAFAADWPQFLGPNRDSASTEKVSAWTEDPKVLWKAPLGESHSSPVVVNGVVYAFFKPKGKDADALTAFDAKSGEKLWDQHYDREKFTPPFGAGPRGTPCVEDNRIYTVGSTGILACWNGTSGNVEWKVDTLKEFNGKNLLFGVSTSPTVIGDLVIVMVGAKGAGIVAFNKTSGKVVWKTTDDPASYATPLPIGQGEKQQLVFLTGSHLRSLSPTGKELWAVPFKDRLNESSTTPVQVGDMIVASSVTAGSLAVTPGEGEPKQVWKDDKLTCYFSTPVVSGDDLYMINGVPSLTNASITLRCVEAKTGKVRWSKEKIGKYHAAIIKVADGNLLMLDDTGNLILIKPNPKEYIELARSKVCGETWAHPALSDGRLFVRDDKELIALDVSGK